MEHLEEQHSRQLREVKEVHRQVLEAKSKEIFRLGNIIAKTFQWFPMLREMLRMEKCCKLIGFTQELADRLITKREAIVCSVKSIRMNISGNSTSKTVRSRWRKTNPIVASWC